MLQKPISSYIKVGKHIFHIVTAVTGELPTGTMYKKAILNFQLKDTFTYTLCFSLFLSGQKGCSWQTVSTVEQGQAKETLKSLKVTEGLSSSGFDSNGSFAQESCSRGISLLYGLLMDIMRVLDLSRLEGKHSSHWDTIHFLDPKDKKSILSLGARTSHI